MVISLAPLAVEHLEALFSVKNSAAVLKSIPGEYPLDRALFEQKNRLIIDAGPSPDQASFTIFVDGEIAGITGYFRREESDGIEVGYFIEEKWWGRGIATEALRLNLEEMRKLEISGWVTGAHAGENPASGRVLEKAGFVRDGERAFTLPDGSVVMDLQWRIEL